MWEREREGCSNCWTSALMMFTAQKEREYRDLLYSSSSSSVESSSSCLEHTHTNRLTELLSFSTSFSSRLMIALTGPREKTRIQSWKKGKPFSTAQNWVAFPLKTELKQNRNSQERVQTHDSASHYSPYFFFVIFTIIICFLSFN